MLKRTAFCFMETTAGSLTSIRYLMTQLGLDLLILGSLTNLTTKCTSILRRNWMEVLISNSWARIFLLSTMQLISLMSDTLSWRK